MSISASASASQTYKVPEVAGLRTKKVYKLRSRVGLPLAVAGFVMFVESYSRSQKVGTWL